MDMHIIQTKHQGKFMINVWMGLIGDCSIGPYIIYDNLNIDKEPYKNSFLQEHLNLLIEEVLLNTENNMWPMHDGANITFSNRWIGRVDLFYGHLDLLIIICLVSFFGIILKV